MAFNRRLLRFSFRSLLLLVLLVGVAAGWFGNQIRKGKRQYESAIAITSTGSTVLFDHYFDAKGVFIPGASPKPPMPEWLRGIVDENAFASVRKIDAGPNSMDSLVSHLPNITSLRELDLNSVETSDAVMEAVAHLKLLKTLQMRSAEISDDGMTAFASLPHLENLWLEGSRISDEGIKHIAKCRELRTLSLSSTGITDVGAHSLSELHELQTLCLDFNEITDAGLASLKGLTELRVLSLRNTQVTAAGLGHLVDLRRIEDLHLHGCNITVREAILFLVQEQGRSVDEALRILGYCDRSRKGELRIRTPGLADEDVELLIGATNIKSLSFSQESLSDEGLRTLLAAWPNLVQLEISATRLTDRSIDSIAKLKKLEFLSIDGDSISPEGANRLRQLLPDCKALYLPF